MTDGSSTSRWRSTPAAVTLALAGALVLVVAPAAAKEPRPAFMKGCGVSAAHLTAALGTQVQVQENPMVPGMCVIQAASGKAPFGTLRILTTKTLSDPEYAEYLKAMGQAGAGLMGAKGKNAPEAFAKLAAIKSAPEMYELSCKDKSPIGGVGDKACSDGKSLAVLHGDAWIGVMMMDGERHFSLEMSKKVAAAAF